MVLELKDKYINTFELVCLEEFYVVADVAAFLGNPVLKQKIRKTNDEMLR